MYNFCIICVSCEFCISLCSQRILVTGDFFIELSVESESTIKSADSYHFEIAREFDLYAKNISSPVNMHSWSSSNSKSVNTMNSGPLTVTTVDGETHYEIEGKAIDLEKADILEDNDEESIFSPTEVEGAKVTVFKKRHQVVLDYKGHRMVTSNNHNKAFNFVAYN